MGRDLTYEDGEFWIWSTVVDDYIAGPFRSPQEVGRYFMNEYLEVPEEERAYRGGYGGKWSPEKVYDQWYREAVKVMKHPEEGVQIVGLGSFSEGKFEVHELPESLRMTPKLKELQRKSEEERRS